MVNLARAQAVFCLKKANMTMICPVEAKKWLNRILISFRKYETIYTQQADKKEEYS